MGLIHSFDVFDTVLTRRTFRPDEIHLLVARDLIAAGEWRGSGVEWRAARVAAEQAARRSAARQERQEITLADIRRELGTLHGEGLAARGVDLELRHELAEAVPIRSTVRAIEELLARGERVAYASDMYLPEVQLRAMLAQAGAPPAPLFVSSEVGLTKRNGTLFEFMASQLGVSLAEIVHTGDHRDSDYEAPRRLGASAVLFGGSAATLLELEVHRSLCGAAPLLAATLAGAMRAVRLSGLPPGEEYLKRLGTQDGALVHIGFALWLVLRLRELAPGKIAFLARDGYLPERLFRSLAPRLAPHAPSACYVFTSRQALHAAGLRDRITDEDRNWIMAPAPGLTFENWHFRLGLERAEMQAAVAGHTMLPEPRTAFSDCAASCAALLDLPAFVALTLKRAAEARQRARDYLLPRVGADPNGTVIVDIGWNGRMQRSIVEVLELPADERRRVHGLYLGILRTPAGDFGNYTAWLFDLREESRPYCASHFHLFETLFAAPHPTTYGYARDGDGRSQPILAPADAAAPLWPRLGEFHDAVLDVCAGVRCEAHELTAAQSALRVLARKTVVALFRAPSFAQARAFAGLTFSSDQSDMGKQRLIHTLSWAQQYRCFFRRAALSPHHWREGQLAVADAPGLRRVNQAATLLRMWAKRQMSPREIVRRLRVGRSVP